MLMNLVFSSPLYQVIEYPELDAIELVDTGRATGALIQGPMAAGFRTSLHDLASQESTTEEEVEDLISNYHDLMHLPQVMH